MSTTSSSIVDVIKRIAESEAKKIHTTELGVVTSVFPHSNDSDKDNYECNIKLKDKDVELRKVPIATQHIGLSNILHVGDLVLLTFISGDINSPVVIGRLYNDQDRPPISKEEEIIYKPSYQQNTNLQRLNISLPGAAVTVTLKDDSVSTVAGKSSMSANSKGEISLRSNKGEGTAGDGSGISINNTSLSTNVKSGGKNLGVTMNDAGSINMQATLDGKNCQIILDNKGIKITTDIDISVENEGKMTFESKGEMISVHSTKKINIASDGEIIFDAKNIKMVSSGPLDLESTGPMNLKSNAIANVEATGMMTIKGATVNINP